MRSNSAASIARDCARQRAVQLIERGARLQRRDRIDQIADRLRLHQVDPAVHERAQRELARLGEAGTGGNRGRDNRAQHDRTSMRAQLHDIVAGIGGGTGEVGRDDLIDGVATAVVRLKPDSATIASCVGAAGGSSTRRPASAGPGKTSHVAASRSRSRAMRSRAIRCASGPLKRTTPRPPRPGGVAMATMVSRVENMNHQP